MATNIDHHSDLVLCKAYPAFPGPRLRIDSRLAALPAEGKELRPVPSSPQAMQAGDIFHDSLIESGGKLRPRNPWAAVGSLAFQLFLLLLLVVIPLFHAVTLPERKVLTMLYVPPAEAPNAPRLRAPTPTYTSTSIDIPAPIRETQDAPLPPPGTTGGILGGVPGGVIGGVPGGVSSEMLNSAPSVPALAKSPGPAPVKRMRVAARVAEANLIHDVAPQYPPEAGRARIEGTVVLMAVIGKDGSVKDVQVESGLPLLAQAAVDAVKQWRYRPYLLGGEPVEVDSRITINFTLSRG